MNEDFYFDIGVLNKGLWFDKWSKNGLCGAIVIFRNNILMFFLCIWMQHRAKTIGVTIRTNGSLYKIACA